MAASWTCLSLRVTLGALLLLLPVNGAAVEFETIGQEAPVASEPEAAAVRIATTLAEANDFPQILTPEHSAALQRVDFGSRIVIGAFRGAVGTSGYAITVKEVIAEQALLRIVVKLDDPPADTNARFGFTSPYHVVTISKAEFREGVPWVLEDTRGQILARTP